MNSVSAIFFILFIISTIIAFSYSELKNKQHVFLCDAFREKFGFIPAGIIIAQNGGIFLTFQKDMFFFFPLVVKKGRFIVRDMEPQHYDFIRSLPVEMTRWLTIKFSLLFINIILFFAFLFFNWLA
jgi:hypothetical protein